MGLTLVSPPSVWPVSLEEAKAQARVLNNVEDVLITSLIKAATAHVEQTLSLSVATQTWRLTLDAFTDAIELPRGPVQSVTSVQYVGGEGETQTLDSSAYTVDLASSRQWIVRNSNARYPTTLGGINAVSITYVAGFDPVPEDIKLAILLLVGSWHKQREAVSDRPMKEVPFAVDALLQPYRWILV